MAARLEPNPNPRPSEPTDREAYSTLMRWSIDQGADTIPDIGVCQCGSASQRNAAGDITSHQTPDGEPCTARQRRARHARERAPRSNCQTCGMYECTCEGRR